MTAELQRSLGRIEGKLEAVIERLDAFAESQHDLEKRVRKTEHKIHWWSGGAAAVGALLGALGIKLTTH